MSKRRQVPLPDQEMLAIQELAQREKLTVGECTPVNDIETRLKAVRRGAAHSYPSGEIEQMLAEIEQGYPA